MSGLEQKLSAAVNMGREHWDVPLRVELRAYLEFTRHINQQLRQFVERWEHTSSPAAKGHRWTEKVNGRIAGKISKPK